MNAMFHHPPRFGIWLVNRLVPDEADTVCGDFEEVYASLVGRYGRIAALKWFWIQILILIPNALKESIYWQTTMLRNYLSVAFRTLSRNPVFGFINVTGLAVGLACCALITLFVRDELSYDRFNEHAEDIYRLRIERYSSGGEAELSSSASAPMAPAALADIPQIREAVRISQRSYPVRIDDRSYFEEHFFWADSGFFDVFEGEFIQGDARSALSEPYQVVVTESTAKKYFSSLDVIGRTLDVNGWDMTVSAVVRDWPEQTHFSFDFLGSFITWENIQGSVSSNWNWWSLSYHTYFLLAPDADVSAAQARLRELPSRYIGDQESVSGYRQFLYLQPLTDIHLTSHYRNELEANSQRSYVYIFGAVALFILGIACINFMNLSTARSTQRAREVGMRKVCGALRRQLVGQFLGESILISIVALVVALLLIQAMLPVFNNLAFKSLSINYLEQWPITISLVIGAVFVGLLAGIYPAFVLSAFQTVEVLKGRFVSGSGNVFLRQGLVVFQFTISIVLIVAALISQRQLGYMRTADLGFDKEQTLVVNARNNPVITQQYKALKQSMSRIAGVSGVSVSSSIPGRTMNTNVAARQSGMVEDGQTFYYMAVDYDFIDQYGLDIMAGRGLSEDHGSDDSLAWVVNEAAYKALGWQDPEAPLGQDITRQFGDTRQVIGVVRDFNYVGLQYAVEPIILYINPNWYNYASIRLNTDNLGETIDSIQQTWASFSPDAPMDFFFLDQDFDRQYRGEERISGLLNIFTIIAIVIACLGLFALASFIAAQRRKEIGVRKVLGASTSGIVVMLSTSFAWLVVLSTLIAVPLSWFAADQWLNNFDNRITVGWDVFLIAGIAALAIALITISWQSIRAAMANPADTLRAE